MANEHEHDDKDEFNLSGFGKIEEYVPTSTRTGNSMIHAHLRQKLAKHDQLNKKECTSIVMTSEGKQKKPEPVMNEDCSSESNEKWDQPIQLNPRPCDSSPGMDDDIDDHIQLSAQPDAREAISSIVVESHRESNKQPAEVLRFNNNNVSDMSQNAKESQDKDELSKTNSKHMQIKAPPAMMNLYQYAMFANTTSVSHEVELGKEDEVGRDQPPPTDNKSQPLPWKRAKKATEYKNDQNVARLGCTQSTDHMTCTSSLGQENVVAKSSHSSHMEPSDKVPGDCSNNESRDKNVMDTSHDDACIALEKCSETRLENWITMFAAENLDNVATLKSINDENEKDDFRPKAALAYAPPGEPLTRPIQAMEATIPLDLQSGIAMTQAYEERPGAYVIMSSGSAVERTRLPFAHEAFSGHPGFDEASRQDVMSNNQAQGHCHDEINIDEEQMAANESTPVEAEPVEAIFAEVVVWYKRPLNRWQLVAAFVFVVVIIVLGVRLGAEASVPKIVTTLVPTLAPTLVPTLAPTLVPTLAPDQKASIACSFLLLSMDVCRETTSAEGSQSKSAIPTELGVLTNLTYLSLIDNQLTGTIPSEMGAMTSLTHLSLSWNQLTGTIPSEIGAMTNLDKLFLVNNQLTGTIPSELGVLTNLTYLSLNDNQLTGSIPSEVGALTSLSTLSLYSNQLNGTIPSEVGALTSLSTLSLYSNQFTGTIPSEVGALTSLSTLSLYSNQLTGTIPSEMGAMISLTSLDLSENQLNGSIPSEIGKMTSLTYLDLYGNELTGTIHSEIGAMTNLDKLFLDNNPLTGTIPSEMWAMTSLSTLSLYSNQLTGTIPSEVGALTSLTDLSLSWNQLTGTIPSEVGAMTSLSTLSLYSNQLTGTIPSEVGAMTSLTDLFLFSNQLIGTIPSEIGVLTSLSTLSLSGNQLTGTIPSEMGAMTSLTFSDLSYNQLTGTIPSDLSHLNASSIHLYNNSLSGTISTELCQSVDEILIDCADIECNCCLSGDDASSCN